MSSLRLCLVTDSTTTLNEFTRLTKTTTYNDRMSTQAASPAQTHTATSVADGGAGSVDGSAPVSVIYSTVSKETLINLSPIEHTSSKLSALNATVVSLASSVSKSSLDSISPDIQTTNAINSLYSTTPDSTSDTISSTDITTTNLDLTVTPSDINLLTETSTTADNFFIMLDSVSSVNDTAALLDSTSVPELSSFPDATTSSYDPAILVQADSTIAVQSTFRSTRITTTAEHHFQSLIPSTPFVTHSSNGTSRSLKCCCRCCSTAATNLCRSCSNDTLASSMGCAQTLDQPQKLAGTSQGPSTKSTSPFDAYTGQLFETKSFQALENLTVTLASLPIDVKTKLSFGLGDTIVDCRFNGRSCNMSQ